MKKIAIVGSGISGIASAYLLSEKYDITIYEKNEILGGHARTKEINYSGNHIKVDTGFIVYNEVNYPNLSAMFKLLEVETAESDMTFSFSEGNGKFEWGAKNLNSIFGQRRNLFNPQFYKMILDVRKFFVRSVMLSQNSNLTLGNLLNEMSLGKEFCEKFILPMGAAIWSTDAKEMLNFPANTFVTFFKNHGLLSFNGQHKWRTVEGGAYNYIEKILNKIDAQILLNSEVINVWNKGDKVIVKDNAGSELEYDYVIFSSHADETLKTLSNADEKEKSILGSFVYQKNIAYLHNDIKQMPKRRNCWASWNYISNGEKLSLTYCMNLLQNINRKFPLFVTLNPAYEIDEKCIFDKHAFYHPVFTVEAIAMQSRIKEIQGIRNIFYTGAYQRYGFHEDGLLSAINVAKLLGMEAPWQ